MAEIIIKYTVTKHQETEDLSYFGYDAETWDELTEAQQNEIKDSIIEKFKDDNCIRVIIESTK